MTFKNKTLASVIRLKAYTHVNSKVLKIHDQFDKRILNLGVYGLLAQGLLINIRLHMVDSRLKEYDL